MAPLTAFRLRAVRLLRRIEPHEFRLANHPDHLEGPFQPPARLVLELLQARLGKECDASENS
jgi:hypothetical protein